jgi:hypothetical protein
MLKKEKHFPKEIGEVFLEGNSSDNNKVAINNQTAITRLVVVLGFLVIVIGSYLSYCGLSNKLNWNFSFLGINSNLVNATPGALLCVIGLVIIVIALKNFKITVRK